MSKPYKTMCISMYIEDIERLNRNVKKLKRRGHTNMNKSKLIRIALRHLNINGVVDEEKL